LDSSATWTAENLIELWGADTRVLASYSPDRWFLRPEVAANGDWVLREAVFFNTTLGHFVQLQASGCCWAINQLEIGDARDFAPMPAFVNENLYYDAATIWITQDRKITPWHLDSFHGIFTQLTGSKKFSMVKNNPKVHEVMGSQEFLPFEQMYVSPSLEAECLKKGCNPYYNFTRQRCPCQRKRSAGLNSFAAVNVFEKCEAVNQKSEHEQSQGSIFGGDKIYCLTEPLQTEEIDLVECTINPGEMLFVPSGWWHNVESLSDKPAADAERLTIMISQWFFSDTRARRKISEKSRKEVWS